MLPAVARNRATTSNVSEDSTLPASLASSLCASVRRNARHWEHISASAFVIHTLLFEMWDRPQRLFINGKRNISQSAADLEFGLSELAESSRVETYHPVSATHAKKQLRTGVLILRALVTWQREKPRFIINFKGQSTHWDKTSVRMEKMSSLGSCLCSGDRIISFDWSSGYRQVVFHSAMWDWFFSIRWSYYRYIASRFGLQSSPYWFVTLLSPLPRYMREWYCQCPCVWTITSLHPGKAAAQVQKKNALQCHSLSTHSSCGSVSYDIHPREYGGPAL